MAQKGRMAPTPGEEVGGGGRMRWKSGGEREERWEAKGIGLRRGKSHGSASFLFSLNKRWSFWLVSTALTK
jgi:hypothetical protein